jgi:hypothetical protein
LATSWLIGSYADNDFAGRVWIFNPQTGDTLFRLENPNPESRFADWFGFSVAANERIIAVSADEDGTNGLEASGTVYVFDAITGQLQDTLYSPRAEADGEFGRHLTITPQGDVLVGAFGESVEGIKDAGRAYLFDGETGSLLLEFANPEPEVGIFAWSVAATESEIIIGSPAQQAVYVFETIPEPSSIAFAVTLSLSALGIALVQRWRAMSHGIGSARGAIRELFQRRFVMALSNNWHFRAICCASTANAFASCGT